MAGQFNISLGREVELYNRVDTNDGANSALIMLVIAYSGMEADSVLRTYDTVAAILAASNNEVTNAGYARKTLTDSSLSAFSPDDTNNLVLLTLPIQTFSSIVAGDTWGKIIVAYDNDTTGGSDTNLIPISYADVRYHGTYVVPNGGDIVIDYSAGWIQAK